MTPPSPILLLRVRRRRDLARVRREVAAFFAARKRRNPGWVPEPMLGIWVDASMAREVPGPPAAAEGGPARVRETFGLAGVWELCWLEDEGRSGMALLEALLAAAPDGGGHFIPVFRAGEEEALVRLEVGALRERLGARVLAPWSQDPDTGRLSPAAPAGSDPAPPEESPAGGPCHEGR